ncbi:MAG: TDP-N-acetylfucosamine:lipid II N-acetylfucosaminyltransferase [Salinivirgaceae bacterium]
MKYLHLITDDKFTDSTIDLFETINQNNNIYLIFKASNEPLKYVQSNKITVTYSQPEYNQILDSVFDLLIVHSLNPFHCKTLRNYNSNKLIFLITWGGDIYNEFVLAPKLFLPKTEMFILKNTNRGIKNKLSNIYGKFKLPFKRRQYRLVLQKIAFCSTIIPLEFERLKSLPYFNAKQIHFNYNINVFLKEDERNLIRNEQQILVGNSATYTNNHIDIFNILSKIKLDNKKIIVPLSYGSDEIYKAAVINEGNKLFGSNFEPIVNFMPIQKYEELLARCEYAFFYFLRQQAMGNIITLIMQGTKIYLSKNNVIYNYLTNIGIKVFSIEQLLEENKELIPLSNEDKINNQKIILSEYGKDAILQRARDACKLIDSYADIQKNS